MGGVSMSNVIKLSGKARIFSVGSSVGELEGKGPFVPMRDWLSSTDLAKSGLRSVIWDIPVRYLVQSFPRSTHK